MEVQRGKKSVGGKLMRHFSVKEGAIPMVGKKASKPITEKRRRDRINKCLVQLKNIVMRATGKDEKRFAKMEKADILEMTIGHLVEMHQKNIGKRFVDHWGIATPEPVNPLDPFRSMKRNTANDNLQQGFTHQSFYPDHLFCTPTYKCGYSGDKEIMDVNFDTNDVMESSSVMCGSASRVFIFADDNNGMKCEKSSESPMRHHINLSRERNQICYTSKPLFTSTPVDVSAIKPIRTSTPIGLPTLTRGYVSPDELLLSGRYDINLNTSPDLRVRLFTSSEESSDGSLVRKSGSASSGSESSSLGTSCGSKKENGVWRPW
ncbi:uncharacterized protein LOC133171612 [Saccostrea echinata]|uniref:uncharacterized protein LOC133171612 n=1 Tax=Saccostrea echinata TaxID=191078 RepID=UPI002A7FCC57|nr:uncharacterized protein LOC133171612 [Saccostrea echinata]